MTKRSWLVAAVVLSTIMLVSMTAYADTSYYVDPDWTGTASGLAAQPWSNLGTAAWNTINSALATGDVIVYFSSREAGSDVSEQYSGGVDITKKSASPLGRLTLDGKSKYNTNDASPSWSNYTGQAMCKITGVLSQNSSHTKYNRVTVRGFNIIAGTAKAVSIAGDEWVVSYCDISHAASASDGPLVLIVPTADSAHEGSSAWTPPCNDIVIENNRIHDSYGELVYVGAAGLNPGESGSGYPSHSNIMIRNNKIYNGGVLGGEGDGLDLKACLTQVTIQGNEIYSMTDSGARAIVMQGQIAGGPVQNIVIERNYIHDCTNWSEAISLSQSWGSSNGVFVRNNIIDTVAGEGIIVYSGSGVNLGIYSNTIYKAGNVGIRIESGNSATVIDNALLSNNSGGQQTSLSGTIVQSNNAYSGSWGGGTSPLSVAGLSVSDFVGAEGGDFTPSSGSLLLDKGTSIASFSDDYFGAVRPPSVWDIGAIEGGGLSLLPSAPTGLRIAQ